MNTSTCYLPVSVSFAYDLNGNLTNDGRRVFFYDDENQLITVLVSNAWKSEFSYDGNMRRRERRECAWSGGQWVTNAVVRYVYDGNLVVQEGWFAADNGVLTPQQTVTYTRGRDLSGSLEGAAGIGGLLARTENAKLTTGEAHAFYHADGNGNVTALINEKQVLVARYLYDPYGNILGQSGPLAEANLYRFSSKELHLNSGLVYYLLRYYEPSLQRWLNRDPLASQMPQKNRLWGNKLHIELEQGPNLYWPFRNNPINDLDPDGQFVPVLVCAIIAAVVVCGCSKAPEPPPNDPYGCWASTDPKKLGKTPGQGAGKPIGCLARQTGCFDCCEKNEPINGGNPQKYAECIAACEQNNRKCAGLSTSGPRQ